MRIDKDYYAILQLSSTATAEQIRQAHRKLVRVYHPDQSDLPNAKEKFQQVQEAYEVLSDASQRAKYDRFRKEQGYEQPPAIALHPKGSHKLLRPLDEPQAYYALLKITPVEDLPQDRMPLNLALVLDRSTSMKGVRLQHVKEAVNHIVDSLQGDDVLALVSFSDRAEILLPAQRHLNKARAKSIVSTIQPSGGTEIFQGLAAGLEELKQYRSGQMVNHLILLTDGQTYGDEPQCLERAEWAGKHQISLSTIGIGTDWNEDLLDQMANVAGGSSIYIDSVEKTKSVFSETMKELEAMIARNLQLTINLNPNANIHEIYQMAPYIRRLKAIAGDPLKLGPLSKQRDLDFLIELRVQNPPVGKQELIRFRLEGELPGRSDYRNWVERSLHVEVAENANLGQIPGVIATMMGKLSIYKMQEKVMEDLEEQKIGPATRRLEMIATRLLNMGETELAHAALLEAGQLARTGHLSAAGRKKIRYGTRALTSPLKLMNEEKNESDK